MNFQQIYLILVARRHLVFKLFLSTILVTLAVSLIIPKTYKATASVLLNYKGVDPLTGLTLPGQLLPGYMATQIDIITSKNVALKVIDKLKLAEDKDNIDAFNDLGKNHGNIRDWLAARISKRLDVVPSRESSVVEINFKGNTPEYAAKMANAFATEYQQENVMLRVEPMKMASAYFNDQVKQLHEAVEAAQERMSVFQQKHGIINGRDKFDIESKRLDDLTTQLVIAQGQAMEATSRSRTGRASESPEVVANPLIQNLKAQLSIAESKFADLSEKLDKNHPQYIASKAEIAKLRSAVNEQTAITKNSVGNSASSARMHEAALRAAVEEQRSKVLILNRTRNEMSILEKDLETAQKALATASERFAQTKIEGQSGQSDISILNPATPPLEAWSPKLLLNFLMSIFLGLLLGTGVALMVEMFNRYIRSESDLASVMNAPVLGVIQKTTELDASAKAIGIRLSPKLRLH